MVADTYHPAPEWLTKDYVEFVLRKYKQNNSLQITQLDIKPATAKGENYASIMTRIKVNFRLSNSKDTQEASYIVKTSYENDPYVENMMKPYDIYNTEMKMYEQILPKLAELLKEIGDKDKLFAETVHVDYEHSAIIFEDLAVSDFGVADRLAGMDMVHTKLALKKLAKMHATSSVLNERMPGVLEKFDHGIFNHYTRNFGIFFENMFEVCAHFADECDELGSYYKEKLLNIKPHVVDYALRVYDAQEGYYKTLTHGDYWINNVMIRYGTGASAKVIKDMMIIDFQFSNWSSPAVDLHYFFNTSLQSELCLYRQEELFQYYHQVLTQTLRELKYAGHIPSLHDFCIQMEAGRFYAVTSALVQQAMMINDKTEDADFHALMKDDERGRNFRKVLYTNKALQESVKHLLPVFDRKGLLDVVD